MSLSPEIEWGDLRAMLAGMKEGDMLPFEYRPLALPTVIQYLRRQHGYVFTTREHGREVYRLGTTVVQHKWKNAFELIWRMVQDGGGPRFCYRLDKELTRQEYWNLTHGAVEAGVWLRTKTEHGRTLVWLLKAELNQHYRTVMENQEPHKASEPF